MNERLKAILAGALPPFAYRRVWRRIRDYGYFGSFRNWSEALEASSGYDSEEILERVHEAHVRLTSGQARGERDSVPLAEPDYSFPAIAALLRSALQSRGTLRVLDLGGSLGGTYFQYRTFFPRLEELRWTVVEQPAFAERGQKFFSNEELTFSSDLGRTLAAQPYDVALLSGVLSYLPTPYDVLRQIRDHLATVVIDRTPFQDQAADRLVVQCAPPTVYRGSYPAWLFSRSKLLAYMEPSFSKLAEFTSGQDLMFVDAGVRLGGYIFVKR